MVVKKWVVASSLLLVGCGVSWSPTPTSPPKATTPTIPANDHTTTDTGEESPAKDVHLPDSDTGGIELVDDDGSSFKKYLEDNKGKVILVDCWATWCGPCMEGFPKTVALHEKFKQQGLVVVGVSFDDQGENDEEKKAEHQSALAFLTKQKANFKNFLARTGIDTESGKPFGVTLQLPAYRLIDRQGKDRLDKKLTNEELEEQLPNLVEMLLKESP